MKYKDYFARIVSKACSIYPKDKNQIAIYSSGEYSANLLSLYRAMKTSGITNKFNVIWIEPNDKVARILSKNGVRVFKSPSPEAYLALCSSKFLVSSHGVPLVKSRGQISIELWHGVPLKSLGRFSLKADHQKFKLRAYLTDYFIVTSSFTKLIFSSVFGADPLKFLELGSPVTDVLLNPLNKIRKYVNNEFSDFDFVFFYLPTYRGYDRGYVLKIVKRLLTNKKLDSFLEETNSLFLIKAHPWDEHFINKLIAESEIKKRNIKMFPNIVLWASLATTYDILAFTDVLVTDYSSVYFDYLLLNRPIVFYIPDLEKYRETRGFLLEPYERWTPGDKARTVDELIHALEEAINNPKKWERERTWLRDVMFKYQDGKASERIIKYFWGE